jgi:uncharacterized membrane protein
MTTFPPRDRAAGEEGVMSETPELSVIVLGYRAGESLRKVAEPLLEQLELSAIDHELVLVANYWPDTHDTTPDVARRLSGQHARVRTIAEEKRGGMGWDMRSGLAAARGDVLVVLDGDAQYPVDDVLRMYHGLRDSGAEVMKGRRTLRLDGAYRRLVSITYNVAFRLMFRTRGLWDINGKPKAMTRHAYEALDLRADDWFIDAEIVLNARERGLQIAELPVTFLRNTERESFVRPGSILEFARNMFRRRLLDRRVTRRSVPATASVVLAALAAVGYAVAAIDRYDRFGANAYDLGIFDQTVWGYSRFDWIPNTVLRLPHELGDHTDFTLVLLTPLYWVWSDPRMLLAAQAVLLAAAGVPLFWWARERLGVAVALVFELAYLLWYGVLAGDIFDFHELALAAPLVSLALYAMLQRHDTMLVIAAVLLLLTKEDLALTLLGFAAYVAIVQRRWRFGGAIAAASVAWFVLAFKVLIPAFAGGRAYSHWSYDALGRTPSSALKNLVLHPIRAAHLFVAPHTKQVALFNLFGSWLFLPLVSPLLIVMAPTLAERFLSSTPTYWAQGFHYSLVIAPMLGFAAVDATARTRRHLGSRTRLAVAGTAVAVLVVGLYFTFGRLRPLDELGRYATTAQTANIRSCLATVPPDASIAATSALVPHLAHRRHIWVIDDRPVPRADVLAIDVATWIYPRTAADLGSLTRRALRSGYGISCSRGTTVVLAQGATGGRLSPELQRVFGG